MSSVFVCVNAETIDIEKQTLIEYLYKNGGVTSWEQEENIRIVNLGKVGDYTLCHGSGSLYHESNCSEEIGKYKIFANKEYMGNPLGLYLVKDEIVYPFNSDSYNNKLITDELVEAEKELPSLKEKKSTVKSGEKVRIFTTEDADTVKYVSNNPKIATVTQKGFVTGLKKGTAQITVTMDRETVTKKIKVTTDPELTKKGKAVKIIEVKKNRTVTLKLKGKAKAIKNSYTNTKTAKIISKKNTTFIKVRGLRKGTTTLKIKVNGVKVLKLKVKVK